LRLTHASTAPTGNTITLSANTTKSHAKDTPVYIIRYDQIEYSHADTETGSKTVLATNTIDPTMVENFYQDTTSSSGYYFTRFKDSVNTLYSAYSDPIPFSGYALNTFGAAMNSAMKELNYQFSDNLTFDMMVGWANEMLSLVRGKLKKWSTNQEFDSVLGTASQGVRKFSMPTTIYDPNTNKSVNNVRVGNAYPLNYMDHSEYLQATEGVSYTEVATLAVVADTSLVLDDTSDLEDSGSIDVYVSGTKYTVEYTANSKATNTLTVDTDQITYAFPVDSPVWQNVEEGSPEYYAILDGYLYLWPMIDSTYEGENVYIDFYTDIISVDSEADVITGPRYDALKQYLKHKIRAVMENSGKENLKDPSYVIFREIIGDAIRLEELGTNQGFVPRNKAVYGGQAKSKR
jgi:hypothetical protein